MARIAKKKRKVNRARSAKKGWRTRRQNNPALAKAWRKKQAKAKGRNARKFRSTEEAIIEAEVKRRLQEKEPQIRAEIRKEVEKGLRGELEAKRSKLVAQTVNQVLVDAPEGFVETDFSKIRARMDLADLTGDPVLEAGILADEFDYEIREIWSIYYGSDPDT